MKEVKAYFAKRFSGDINVRSVLVVENPNKVTPLVDGYDLLFLIISENRDLLNYTNYTSHYIKENYRIQERRIHPEGLEAWIVNGTNRSVIQWIIQGEILLDRETYLEGLRHRLLEFPQWMREQKLLIEFSMFLRTYLQSRDYLQEGHTLDAYSQILKALHHWARIVIIEAGIHPEVTVWSQVRRINAGVYKLYEELTLSKETLEQRVELVLLASEFSAMSKMAACCTLLMRVLESRDTPWSAME
ncbi:MAG TPA: nucleotidyltransferase-like protein, partial [Bacilli bacterium]